MYKLQTVTKKDLQEASKIACRRNFEEERKQRIFNPRIRLIGVDRNALDEQVDEKTLRKQQENELHHNYDKELERRNIKLNDQLNDLANERFQLQCEINEFRNQYQRKEHSREFDLNDPNYVRNSLPARISDTDSRLSLSGAQIFMGEDLVSIERKRQQQLQQKAWIKQQIQEREQARVDFEKANRLLEAAMNRRDARIKEIDDADRQLRRQIKHNTAQYNIAMAREQQAKRMQKKQEDEEDNLAEIINNITSDMLTEDKDTGATSQFGVGRKNVAQYRGMTDDEIKEIRNEQLQQINEMQQQKLQVAEKDKQFDEILMSRINDATNNERENNRIRRELDQQRINDNKDLSKEQRDQQMHLNNVVYANEPTEEYFKQFNTTTR